jgi:hypothetical protein
VYSEFMPSVSLKAHFDGETIRLDEPYTLPKNAQLLITVLPSGDGEDERTAWYALSSQGLARAYSDDEPEYTEADLEP